LRMKKWRPKDGPHGKLRQRGPRDKRGSGRRFWPLEAGGKRRLSFRTVGFVCILATFAFNRAPSGASTTTRAPDRNSPEKPIWSGRLEKKYTGLAGAEAEAVGSFFAQHDFAFARVPGPPGSQDWLMGPAGLAKRPIVGFANHRAGGGHLPALGAATLSREGGRDGGWTEGARDGKVPFGATADVVRCSRGGARINAGPACPGNLREKDAGDGFSHLWGRREFPPSTWRNGNNLENCGFEQDGALEGGGRGKNYFSIGGGILGRGEIFFAGTKQVSRRAFSFAAQVILGRGHGEGYRSGWGIFPCRPKVTGFGSNLHARK